MVSSRRRQTRKHTKPELGESWVVESGTDRNSDTQDPYDTNSQEGVNLASSKLADGERIAPDDGSSPDMSSQEEAEPVNHQGRSRRKDYRGQSKGHGNPSARGLQGSVMDGGDSAELIMPSIHEGLSVRNGSNAANNLNGSSPFSEVASTRKTSTLANFGEDPNLSSLVSTSAGMRKLNASVQTRGRQGMRRSSRASTPSTSSEIKSNHLLETSSARLGRTPKRQGAKSTGNLINTSDTVYAFIKPILSFVYDVLSSALHKVKTPISYGLAIYLLLGLSVLLRNLLTSSIYTALSPICRFPGASLLNLPICAPSSSRSYKGANPPPVEFDQLMNVQSKYEAILEASAGGVSLPLDMKRGEASVRDLRQVVRYSQLSSRDELVFEFDGFVDTARVASYDLQKFNSHVGRGVDNILSTARWTKRVLDDFAIRDSSKGAVTSFVSEKLFSPFQPIKFTEDKLVDQYIHHTRVVEEELHRLIMEAQALLLVLQNLEDRLDTIHGIAVRDNLHAKGSHDEVLQQLWTMLGGNRSKLGKYDSQLKLLQQVNAYRQSAFAHVSGTILKMQAMSSELEELRERVGSAGTLRNTVRIPLAVHIENIELGVQRLEIGRGNAKKMENEILKKTLDRGGTDSVIREIGTG